MFHGADNLNISHERMGKVSLLYKLMNGKVEII